MSGPEVFNGYRKQRAIWAVDIMRGTKWGNPFRITAWRTREQAIAMFREYLEARPDLVADAKRELRGRDLRCCCAPKACHGDVLLEIANAD